MMIIFFVSFAVQSKDIKEISVTMHIGIRVVRLIVQMSHVERGRIGKVAPTGRLHVDDDMGRVTSFMIYAAAAN